jgi:hypothetical protein
MAQLPRVERFIAGIIAGGAHACIFRISPMITPEAVPARAVPPNKQLQRTVIDKVPRHMRQRAAAELPR